MHLIKFNERAAADNLRCELTSLTLHWDKLKTSALEEYMIIVENKQDKNSEEYDDWDMKFCSACKNCVNWLLLNSVTIQFINDAYNVVSLVYKFLLALCFMQVACEKSFSTLKII